MDYSPPSFSAHGPLRARILEWVAISFSRGSSQPRNWTQVSCSAGRFFTDWATREAISLHPWDPSTSITSSKLPVIAMQMESGCLVRCLVQLEWGSLALGHISHFYLLSSVMLWDGFIFSYESSFCISLQLYIISSTFSYRTMIYWISHSGCLDGQMLQIRAYFPHQLPTRELIFKPSLA